jgi:PAS domain S-box-containing protein
MLVNSIERSENENNLLKAKEAAERNEEKFRLMIKNSNDSFVLINKQAEQFYISDAAIRDTGFSIEELRGPIENVIYPTDIPIVRKAWNDLLNNKGEMLRVQYRHKHKHKDYIWYEAVCQNHLDNPAINAVVVNVRDITAIKEQEIELIKSKERAEISDRLKSAFLANMSHEIRTPMNGILGFAELLKEPDLAGEQQQEFIKIIEKSGLRMLNIINDIIDISKIEAGLMNVNKSELSISKLVEYIYAFFSPEARAKGLEIFVDNQLAAGEDIVFTDHEKLYAILTNLVKNAIKFTNSGSIILGFEKKENNFEFYIKDTGIGISENRQQTIFERFVQAADDNQMIMQGAGLGLAISKAYTEILEGKIWVESEIHVGSTFFFSIPCIIKHKTVAAENIFNSSESSLCMKEKLKILIAEDDKISEMLIEFMVKSISKEIIKTNSGCGVVDICRNNPDIDLILLDMQMPEKNGYEAAKEIREFNSNVIIIAQTAFGLEGDREKVIQAGCNDYLSKPIKKKDLLKLLPKYFK